VMISRSDRQTEGARRVIAGVTPTLVVSPPPGSARGVAYVFLLAHALVLLVPGASLADQAATAPLATALRCGKPGDPRVALTFDDGPTARHTRQVLAILQREHVKATFFVLGQQAKRSPELLKLIVAQGHLIATHSWDHPRKLDLASWRAQLRRTREAIVAAGITPAPYFRPPHGTVTPALRQACGEEKLTIVLYTLLSSDWTLPGSQALTRQVVRGLAEGGIVVMHDGGGDRRQTVEALPAIIRGLRARGLEPVRLDELLGGDPKVESCARPKR
jgi:peptidoglycan-N-acetylglucosamine deacetylase